MQRLATTVATAAWIGFLGVFSLELGADVVAPDLLAAASSASWPAVTAQIDGIGPVLSALAPFAELAVCVACLVVMGLFARGLFDLHRGRAASVARGETLAFAGLGCIAVLAGAAQLTAVPLLPIDLDGGLVWLAIALSIAAVAFDRLVSIDVEDEKAEAEFQASLSVLARRMGQQAALYTLPDAGSATQGKGDKR